MSTEVKKIFVVSNTHWDREFRFSFEKTRYKLLKMMDTVIDILENDPEYHSFTLDGHTLLIEDYLEIRPENYARVRKLISDGRLIIGPYYTLAEQFSISHEALVRNLSYGKRLMEKYGAKPVKTAYTPSSWGQTGQYPQILKDFGIEYMMFYRGISHDEAPAEYVWEAPDGTSLLASRFALYCRYNWYYQVHRAVSRHKVFNKDYHWAECDEIPYRRADVERDEGIGYDLKAPTANYDKAELEKAVEDMLIEEQGHFTTPIFLAMNGHDISCAYPLESQVIKDAKEIFDGKYEIIHTDLDHFWEEAEKYLDRNSMVCLKGERRSYLKKGKWTYLFPSTISARTNMKQHDFNSYTALTYLAEPMSAVSNLLCDNLKHEVYLDNAWKYLLSNHTHDANGGGAVTDVCTDMRYRYKKVFDISNILVEDSTAAIIANLSPEGDEAEVVRFTVFNTLPFERDVTAKLEFQLPEGYDSFEIEGADIQPISSAKSSTFVDSIWEVPTILDVVEHKAYVRIKNIPALGYKSVKIRKGTKAAEGNNIANGNVLENEHLKVTVNNNGTVDILVKASGKTYENVNYLTSQGEIGNAWKHVAPNGDKKFCSCKSKADISVCENGALRGTVKAEYEFSVPAECDGVQSSTMVSIPVSVLYTLDKDSKSLSVKLTLNNTAKDHWLRANFPTEIKTDCSYSDSHFDIVKRAIAVPDSTGWVETAYGMQPLRTFAAVTDGENGFSVLPKGLYEYEVFEDDKSTMALTLIRACRIILQVSEEKNTELPDEEIQCPGEHTYEYALHFFGDNVNELPNTAAEYFTAAPCAVSGRGQGTLPHSYSMFGIDNKNIHVTAVKRADSGEGTVIRFYNPCEQSQKVNISIPEEAKEIWLCKMNEEKVSELQSSFEIGSKKIYTILVK